MCLRSVVERTRPIPSIRLSTGNGEHAPILDEGNAKDYVAFRIISARAAKRRNVAWPKGQEGDCRTTNGVAVLVSAISRWQNVVR